MLLLPQEESSRKAALRIQPRECPCWAFTGSRISLQHQGCNLSSNSQWAGYLQWLGRKILKHAGFQVTQKRVWRQELWSWAQVWAWCCSIVWTWLISGDIQKTTSSAHLPVSHNPHTSMVKLLIILFIWLEFESICSRSHTTFSKVQHNTGFPIPVLSFKQLFRPAQSNRTAWNDGNIQIHTVQYGGHQPYVANEYSKRGWRD